MAQNIYANLPLSLPEEVFETLATSNNVKIERIVSKGHTTPPTEWYDQEQAEWVILLSGKAKLKYEADSSIVDLNPGDYLFIPPHVKHRVEWTDPNVESIWLAIHIYDSKITQ